MDQDARSNSLEEQRNAQLMILACAEGKAKDVEALLAAGFPPHYQEEKEGTSLLMHAARGAHLEIVQILLAAGAPWMAVDRHGKCAGEYAIACDIGDANRKQSVIDFILNHAVMAEMLLGTVEDQTAKANVLEQQRESHDYLGGTVRYERGRLVDQVDEGVMMEWEAPLMEAHASFLCGDDGNRDILNVGFGLGIIDRAIQRRKCRSHTIIEAHPMVLEKMKTDGWYRKAGVTIETGRWQNVLPRLVAQGKKFDGIFFDTYAEHYRDMQGFHAWLPKVMRPGGIYSFFNGLCPDNLFFHAVACQLVKLELEALKFSVDFANVEIEGGASDDNSWKGLRRRYWHGRDEYFLPVAVFEVEEDERAEVTRDALVHPVDSIHGIDGLDSAKADDTLIGEVTREDGTKKEVLLHASLDPEAGGITWRPYTDMEGRSDSLCLLNLRCWFPPMLHDLHRYNIFKRAIWKSIGIIKERVDEDKVEMKEKGDKDIRILDIGTGTGLLSLEAVRAGATQVTACDGFTALAKVADEVVRSAGLERNICVVHKMSSALDEEEIGSIDLIVAEILDSTLLGEGYLSTLRDLYTRGLVDATTHVVPRRARVWAQLVECPELQSHFNIPSADVTCMGDGRPKPLHLSLPYIDDEANNWAEDKTLSSPKLSILSRKKREILGEKSGGPISSKALSAPFILLEIDFAAAAAESKSSVDSSNGPIIVGPNLSVPILSAGSVQGALMWWELICSDGVETYSSAPRDIDIDPLWQDHWKPCIWPITLPFDITPSQEVNVQGAHHDRSIWIEIGSTPHESLKRLREGPHPCLCGLHTFLPSERIIELNDARREEAYSECLRTILDAKDLEIKTILDICDGGMTLFNMIQGWKTASNSARLHHLNLVSLEEDVWHGAMLEKSCLLLKAECRNALHAIHEIPQIKIWHGAGRGENWDSACWGDVQVLCGDGYYSNIGVNRPIWSWLNFWILRTALAPILARNVVILPFQVRLMASVIECPSLFRVYGGGNPIDEEKLGGWDHTAFRRAMSEAASRAVFDEDKDLAVSLADYPHRFLTPPALLMRMDLHHAIDWTASQAHDGAYRRNVIHVPFCRAGNAHALALWIDVDLTYGAAVGSEPSLSLSGCLHRYSRQSLRWMSGESVVEERTGERNKCVEIKAMLDVVSTPGIWTDCQIIGS